MKVAKKNLRLFCYPLMRAHRTTDGCAPVTYPMRTEEVSRAQESLSVKALLSEAPLPTLKYFQYWIRIFAGLCV